MWKLIVIADAPPVIVLVATIGCFTGITTESLPATATVVAKLVPASATVNVPAAATVLVTIISVTTVVVDAGTVYSVVVVVVDAAPRYKTFEVVAISYNFL